MSIPGLHLLMKKYRMFDYVSFLDVDDAITFGVSVR